ncbi:SGNH/GDSL hydrolase family protein [Enterococcus casseliflavus]|uniref:SGNH/GDSL hydrolase family protein n=1 Tax=Enterococcus casseliflavus TaxID=37734 RepID=UPI003D13729E
MAYQRHYWKDYDETKTETQNIEAGAVITTEKLNEIENGIVVNYSELDIKKSDKTYVDSMLTSIAQGGPRELFYSLAALKIKYPNGAEGTYLVFDSATTDGAHSYMWDSANKVWKDLGIYQSMKLSDKSVEPPHTIFFVPDEGRNLFEKYSSGITTGSYINNVGSWSNNALYSYSDKINATAGDVFRVCTATEVQSVHGGAFDAAGNWLANIPRANSQWTVPDIAGLSYVRFVFFTSTLDDLMIVKNEPAPTVYIPFKYKMIDGIEIDEQNVKNLDKKVWAKENVEFIVYDQTENLFNKSDPGVTIGRILDPNNNWATATGYSQSHYFEVAPGDIIRKSTVGYGHAFDVDFNHVAYIPWSNSRLTVPNDDSIKYVSCSFLTENIDTLMIVRNQELPSVYVPFKISKLSEDITVDEKQIVRSDVPKMKVYGIGDSISTTSYASDPYWKLINERSAKLAITVDAKSGSRIVKADDRTDSLAERYTAVGSGYDMAYIFMGTNDAQGTVPIGSIDSTDVTTLQGSLNVAITHWMNTYPKMKIAIITPIQRQGNLAGRLRTYSDAIIEIAEKYGIPYFDGLKNSMYLTNIEVRTALSTDGLHPNNDGHAYIANRFESFLSSI